MSGKEGSRMNKQFDGARKSIPPLSGKERTMVKMGMYLGKICILVLVLMVVAAGQVGAQGEKGKPKGSNNAGDTIKKIASSNVIMVVKLVEIEGRHYSGIVGSNFIFEIKKVV